MARRRIGQESLAFTAREPGRNAALDELAAAIDWAPLAKVLDDIYGGARGEAAWPPTATAVSSARSTSPRPTFTTPPASRACCPGSRATSTPTRLRQRYGARADPRAPRSAARSAAAASGLLVDDEHGQDRVERAAEADPLPDREDPRHLQTLLRPGPCPLPRPRPDRTADPAHLPRRQREASRGPRVSETGLSRPRSTARTGGDPPTAACARRLERPIRRRRGFPSGPNPAMRHPHTGLDSTSGVPPSASHDGDSRASEAKPQQLIRLTASVIIPSPSPKMITALVRRAPHHDGDRR